MVIIHTCSSLLGRYNASFSLSLGRRVKFSSTFVLNFAFLLLLFFSDIWPVQCNQWTIKFREPRSRCDPALLLISIPLTFSSCAEILTLALVSRRVWIRVYTIKGNLDQPQSYLTCGFSPIEKWNCLSAVDWLDWWSVHSEPVESLQKKFTSQVRKYGCER